LPDVPEVPKDEEAQHEYDVHGESRADADADTDSEDIETETAPRRGSIIDRVRAERAARTRSVDPDERMPDLEAELDALRARARAWARGMSV
jgi:hypothetical protein